MIRACLKGRPVKRERGADKVFDFTLGNRMSNRGAVIETLRQVARRPGSHGYAECSYPALREVMAAN